MARDVRERKVTPSLSFGKGDNWEAPTIIIGSEPILLDLTVSEKERWKLLI